MDLQELHHIFLQGADLVQEGEEGIWIGDTHPSFVPSGVDAVMSAHTTEIDKLRAKLPGGSVKELELFVIRGFTFAEYQALFDNGIREKDYAQYPALRSLWITTETERRKKIYQLDRESHEDYFKLLAQWMATFNQNLQAFFFTAVPTC